MKDCIFCKVLRNEAEASFVYHGDIVSAFMDLHPVNRGHVLVVPNEHHERFTSLNDSIAAEMFRVARIILAAIEESDIKCEGANLFLSDVENAGQEVPHSHLHIAPRFKGDGHRMGFYEADPDESNRFKLNEVALKIANEM